jgi:drug/metabolite transporter (DMT)-like permease
LDQPTNPNDVIAPSAGPVVRPPAGEPSAARIWAGIWVIYLVWGSTYLGIAVAVESIPPFVMAAVRFLLAGGILLAWTVLRHRRDWRTPSRRQVRDTAIVGALLLGGGMGMVAFGEQSVPSGITAVLIALMPLWLAVFGWVLLGDRLPRPVMAGIALGVVGVVVLAWPGDASLDGVQPLHLLAVFVSPISWSLGTLFAARRARLPEEPLVATGLQMVLGSAALAVMALASGELATWDPGATTTASIVAFAYLTVVGSLFAFTVFAWLLRVAPLPKVATYAYVNPIVAVILGTIVLGEPLTARTLLAGAIIVASVALIVTARGRVAQDADISEADEIAAAPLETGGAGAYKPADG